MNSQENEKKIPLPTLKLIIMGDIYREQNWTSFQTPNSNNGNLIFDNASSQNA